MVCKIHRAGASFRGVTAYCLGEKRERGDAPDGELAPEVAEELADAEAALRDLDEAAMRRWGGLQGTIQRTARLQRVRGAAAPAGPAGGRVEWTETVNLATDDPRQAARQMAATVGYAGELKRLAGVSAAGRKLQKPVTHYTLSWAPGERPARAEMTAAARSSLEALGLQDRQAVLVAHRDGKTPHVHVIANRVSAEDGRAAQLSHSRLALSKWAEAWEREHGGIRCRRRAEHNRRRRGGERVVDRRGEGDARHRRKGELRRAEIPAGRTAREIARSAVERVDERRKWEAARKERDAERGRLDRRHRGEWSELYKRQERERERLEADSRTLRGRVRLWRETGRWTDLAAAIRRKPEAVLAWTGAQRSRQRQERAELGREQGRQAREADRRAQQAYERAMAGPVRIVRDEVQELGEELRSQEERRPRPRHEWEGLNRELDGGDERRRERERSIERERNRDRGWDWSR